MSEDTGIIMGIIAFQAVIILCLGFLQVSYVEIGNDVATVDTTVEIFNVSFGQNLITNISSLGFLNVLIFSPLIAGFGYIIAKLIRGGG